MSKRENQLVTLLLVATAIIIFAGGLPLKKTNEAEKPDSDKQRHSQSANEPARKLVSESLPSDSAAQFATPLEAARGASLDKVMDPKQDGWQSEAMSEMLQDHLKEFAKQALHLSRSNADNPLPFLDPAFSCGDLKPPTRLSRSQSDFLHHHVQSEANFQVHRGTTAADAAGRGLRELFDLHPPEYPHWKIKLYRVAEGTDQVAASALFQIDGRCETGQRQVNARWDATWSLQDGELRLLSISVLDYTENHSPLGKWFRDDTLAVIDGGSRSILQLRNGVDHWLRRIEELHGIHDSGRNGLAIGDVNGDLLPDLYVCQNGGLPNRLFVQQPDGSAVEVAAEAGVDWLDNTPSALLIDIDNDGDSDLVCGFIGAVILMENDGTGRFTLRKSLEVPDHDVKSMAAADYDLDGDLDLYVCVDLAAGTTPVAKPPFVYHDANDGGANVLFHNRTAEGSPWEFIDATEQTGLNENNHRHSLAASWEDYDNDGDPDLYVANDYGRNSLYRNDNGHFTDVADVAGVVDSASGMSVSWGDYDSDGLSDLYVANMWSSAGGRITDKARFKPEVKDDVRDIYKRFAKGNSLFKNEGNGRFSEVGGDLGVEMGRWAWSSLLSDVNNDGWDDALIANGYLTTEDSGDL